MPLASTVRFIAYHPLNRRHRLRSVIRFARWQIGSRLLPGTFVYEWINGSKFLVKRGETGVTGNVYTGLHEFSDMAFLLHFLRDEDLFVDVGANVGSYTILACSAVGARGIAFEPVPSTYARLSENMRLNHLDEKTRCINQGVGARQGRISFTSDSDTTNHALAPDERCADNITVETTTLDTALHGESPTMLKIDVEGYETAVLEGARETLRKRTLRSVVMELNSSGNRYGFDESKILDLMLDHEFKMYSYDPLLRVLTNLRGKNQDSGNTLFIRDLDFVKQRLLDAPKFSVHGNEF